MNKLGHMVPYYTLMEGTMVTSPIVAAIASFLVFAATGPPERFTPAAIFAAVALFGILKPPIEDLPHSMVEVRPCLGYAPVNQGSGSYPTLQSLVNVCIIHSGW